MKIDSFDFEDTYRTFYDDYENLDKRIEFSLLINPQNNFTLRFGLFGLNNFNTIESFLNKKGFNIENTKELQEFSERYTPEMAVGFDFDNNGYRTKIYFLRLPDNQQFNACPGLAVNKFLNINGITNANVDHDELKEFYLLCTDRYQNKNTNVKVYSRNDSAGYKQSRDILRNRNIDSEYIKEFAILFQEELIKDVTLSSKYSIGNPINTGISLFFEVENNANDVIEKVISRCLPERIEHFKRKIMPLERERPVNYSHIGLTFSDNMKKESLCVYFSPMVESLQ